MTLLEKIKKHEARVAVIGIGYVGLPLVVEFAARGLPGHRLRQEPRTRSARLNAGESLHRRHPRRDARRRSSSRASSTATDRPGRARRRPTPSIICVPTPLNKTKDPDIRFIVAAADDDRAAACTADMLIVLESTTFPGFTREVLVPKLHASGPQARRGLLPRLLARARRPRQRAATTPRTRPRSSAAPRRAASRRPGALRRDHRARSCRSPRTDAAEMVKLLENTFRAVNIGLVNEVAIMCQQARPRRLGGHRRRGHQAVRLHALLSRARASAGTASPSIRSTCRGSCKHPQVQRALHRARRRDQQRACPSVVVERVQRRAQRAQARRCNGAQGPGAGRRLQARHRRRARVAGARRHRAACRQAGAEVALPRSATCRRCASASTS